LIIQILFNYMLDLPENLKALFTWVKVATVLLGPVEKNNNKKT